MLSTFDDIDFNQLPEKFVLKCNHDSGSMEIIKNKSSLKSDDLYRLKEKYERCLKHKAFYAGREYPYKGIEKRYILAEPFMTDEANADKSIEDFYRIIELKMYIYNHRKWNKTRG